MLLIIDNYDSFVHNLARYCARLGFETHVARNDKVTLADVRQLNPTAIVISPGPCSPTEAGISIDIVKEFLSSIPILGVCLGHQAIAAALGGKIVRAKTPVHGRASRIHHDSQGIFQGVPSPTLVGRYHSLVADEATLPKELAVSARAIDETIMAFSHRDYPVIGVQFHPESILTEHGYKMLANFLDLAGLKSRNDIARLTTSERPNDTPLDRYPQVPVTF